MTNEADPKKSAKICFDTIGLDEELYRIGHTKASAKPDWKFCIFDPHFKNFIENLFHTKLVSWHVSVSK